jgi:hypothetical protein
MRLDQNKWSCLIPIYKHKSQKQNNEKNASWNDIPGTP